ncbi:alpha/beta fold hydrolase [Paragemmobacter straminiformis]|uniref:Alpha/beta hydrolase n=1 Tax=Paragemmobacter straminiformis TaxID=2045119 RepID=A0A842I7U7_9RHOB|nr:alpha/beta hydrolase [Gemmobacter straminiformis]MBC2835473.1 alpha/beta hydrolase [Gemmobacter straminiformis]
MRLKRLARSLTFLAAVAATATAATLYRAGNREARALVAHPPQGQFVDVDGTRVHVLVKGSGPDLVLIHGASGSLRDFSFDLIDRLSPDYRVIAMDRPGLGYSDPLPDGDPSLAAQVAVLKAAADSLGATRPILVGQSYGGTVALSWALDHPAAALVTIGSPSLPWPGGLDPWYRLTETALGRALLIPLASAWVPQSYVEAAVTGVFAPQPVPAGYLAHLGTDLTLRRTALAANVQQINSLRPQIVAMEQRLPSLTLPIELVHGDADSIVPLSIHSAPLALRLPNAHLTVLPGVGHMPHHADPEAVLAAIDRAATRAGLR